MNSRVRGQWFLGGLGFLAGLYALLILGLLVADVGFTSWDECWIALQSDAIRHSIALSFISCTLAALLSLVVAVPAGYLLARFRFRGSRLLDALFDIPIVLPPLVIGLSLLILFQTAAGQFFEEHVMEMTYELPGVVLAQFVVACAFAVRTMRLCFDSIDPRPEQVERTLGCTRAQAFFRVTLPEARGGIIAAGSLAFARALGEFGPILVFSGATRMKTEVLPTTVFLELSVGNLQAALAVSLLMVLAAISVLVLARMFGMRGGLL